jgi:hypothetical protein
MRMPVHGREGAIRLSFKSLMTLVALVVGFVVLYRSNWARKISDIPVHAVLSLTSEFEREGQDPAKITT